MSKALEDLMVIITACACLDVDFISSNQCVKKFESVKNELKRLEIIDRLNEKYSNDIQTKLDDFEWLKHKLNLTFLNSLSSPEDKMRVMKIMGVEYGEEK